MKKIIITIFCVICLIIAPISSINSSNAYADSLNVKSKAAILLDYNSGKVLYENNADARVQVASIVKLMTTLITLERIDSKSLSLDDKLHTSENASGMGGSQVFIDAYEEYSINDMLKSVIVASANDASVALAEHIAGSEDQFVSLMNNRAKELGMNNTLYANCTGLPASEQYSSARDTSILIREVMKHKDYYNYTKIWMDYLTHPSGRQTELVNTNKMIRYYNGCDCGKTGFTDEAGFCLTASAKRGDLRFVAVSLNSSTSQDRFNSVAELFNYGFANFYNKKVVSKDQTIGDLSVLMSSKSSISVYPANDYFILAKKGDKADYSVSYELPQTLKAPILAGTVIGKIIVSQDGNVVEEINIVINEDINKLTYKDGLSKIINNWHI